MSKEGWVLGSGKIRHYILVLVAIFSTITTSLMFSDSASAITGDQAQACFSKFNNTTKPIVFEREKPNRNAPDYDYYSSGCDAVCDFNTDNKSWAQTTCSQEKIDAAKKAELKAAAPDPTDAKNTAIATAYAAKIDSNILSCGSTKANTKDPTSVAVAETQKECSGSVSTYIKECITSDKTTATDTKKLSLCLASKYSFEGDQAKITSLKRSLDTSKDIAIKAGQEAEIAAKDQQDCIDKNGTWENGACKEKDNDAESATTCSPDIGAVGWMVCPVMGYLSKIADGSYGFISEHFLSFDSQLLTSDDTKAAWSSFRNIANILFVVAFLIIIYSQITGSGIDNYGIKRMLPRLIIAAVLVNASYIICAIAVDASNLAGYGINSLFSNIPIGTDANPAGISTAKKAVTWVAVGGLVLASGTAALLALSTPVILASLLSVMMIVLILIARKALILILIVISPLAFVAYLLPNTEQWYKKWYKLFSSLLILFPVIGIVFAGSKLAANIIARSPTSKTGAVDDILLQITALGIATVPFFVVPSMLKGALAATGALGAKLQGLSNKADSRTKSKIGQSRLGEAKQAFNLRRAQRSINRRIGNGRLGRINSAIDNSRVGSYIGGNRGSAAAVAAQQKINREAVDNSVALLEQKNPEEKVNAAHRQLLVANQKGDVISARAAAQVLRSSGSLGKDTLHAAVHSMTTNGAKMNAAVSGAIRSDGLSAGVKDYDSVMDAWNASGGDISVQEANANNIARLNESEIAGQTLKRLGDAQANNAITTDQAKRVLAAHERGSVPLDDKKKEFFEKVANKPVDTAPKNREFTREQIRSMGPENTHKAVDQRGGMGSMSDGDVLSIRNNHGSHAVGQAAREEVIRRGLVTPPKRRNIP